MIPIDTKSTLKTDIELVEIRELVDKVSQQIDRKEIDCALDINIIAYERALAIDNPSIISEILYNFGCLEDLKGHSQKAMSFFSKSLSMAQETQNLKCVVLALNKIASIYGLYGEFRSALDAYNEILKIVEANPETSPRKSGTYNNMGLALLQLNAYDDAEKYYKLALTAAINWPKQTYHDKVIVAIIYGNLSEIYLLKKDYEAAQSHLQLARQHSEDIKDQVGIAFCYHLEAILIHETEHNWEKAEKLFEQAIKLINQCGADYEITDLIIKYGKQAFNADQFSKAQELLEKAHTNVLEHHYLQMEPEICEVLEKIYLHAKRFDKAHLMVRKQLELKNSSNEQWEKSNVKNFVNDVNVDEETRQLEELKRSIRTMKMLAEVGQSITASIDINHIFEIVSETIVKILNLSSFALSLIDDDNISMTMKAFDEGKYKEMKHRLDSENSFMAWCVRNQKEIIIYSPKDILAYQDVMNTKLVERLNISPLKSLLFCPMYIKDQIIGGVTVQSEKPFNFSYVDLEVLRLLTSYIAIAINNIQESQKLLQTNKKLETASRIDGLTGLLNRRALGDYITHEFASTINSSLPVTMVMIDLDYFKQYNDFYGHSKGDQCLISVSNAIKETLRDFPNNRFAFRFGGDEFLIILENCAEDQCNKMLNILFEEMNALHIEHLKSKISDHVTLTAGATIVKRLLTDYTEVFSSADEAMYMAKNSGRNKFQILIVN